MTNDEIYATIREAIVAMRRVTLTIDVVPVEINERGMVHIHGLGHGHIDIDQIAHVELGRERPMKLTTAKPPSEAEIARRARAQEARRLKRRRRAQATPSEETTRNLSETT